MAIKISGSTIIDDSRNVVNAGIITATSFDGSGATLDSIPNGALDNSSVSYGGVSLSLGGSDATPAFDLTDATSYPYGSLTGITTEIVGDTTPQLGGNLDGNSKDIYGVGIITATTFSGSASNMTGLTGASAATYGSSTLSPVITVNSDGKITGISTATISGGGGGALDGLSDVTITQVQTNQVLKYDGSPWIARAVFPCIISTAIGP